MRHVTSVATSLFGLLFSSLCFQSESQAASHPAEQRKPLCAVAVIPARLSSRHELGMGMSAWLFQLGLASQVHTLALGLSKDNLIASQARKAIPTS